MKTRFTDAFSADELAQVLFSAGIDADGRLHKVGGMATKLRALLADSGVLRIHTLVCARKQGLGVEWERFRLPGNGLRLIEADTVAGAMALLRTRLLEFADPTAFADLRIRLPLPDPDTRISRPVFEQALEQAIQALALQAPKHRLPRGYVVVEGEAGTGKSGCVGRNTKTALRLTLPAPSGKACTQPQRT